MQIVLDAVPTRAGLFAFPVFLAARSAPLLYRDAVGSTGDIHAVFARQEATWTYLATSALSALSPAGYACYPGAAVRDIFMGGGERSIRLRGGSGGGENRLLQGTFPEVGYGDRSGVVLDAVASMVAAGPAGPALFTPTPEGQWWLNIRVTSPHT